ncbi:hypothetical protein [Candidimonas nitroreducens]|uniref:Antitermination protein Q n=1 Tax=Candidimonas nitroreducens TaxID=683354 RepID=A0A225MLB5_9BURK|nr:hypothetical protein [Candidimonas nitroreducens]OWT62008.1 hypothetical protein CEY11_09385 [Candidimonas nitroreducens]
MIDPDFERRLENWGAYYRRDAGGAVSSPTAEVCELLAVAHGRQIRDGYREVSAKPEIDESDAETIEWCWCRAAYRMDAKLRALLKAHYVHASDMRFTCRVLQIRFRSYEPMRADAVEQFQRVVALAECMGDNCAKTI